MFLPHLSFSRVWTGSTGKATSTRLILLRWRSDRLTSETWREGENDHKLSGKLYHQQQKRQQHCYYCVRTPINRPPTHTHLPCSNQSLHQHRCSSPSGYPQFNPADNVCKCCQCGKSQAFKKKQTLIYAHTDSTHAPKRATPPPDSDLVTCLAEFVRRLECVLCILLCHRPGFLCYIHATSGVLQKRQAADKTVQCGLI